MEQETCVYCGTFATCRDHVLAIGWTRNSGTRLATDWTVAACGTCNSALWERPLVTVPNRALWLWYWYKKKFRKTLSQPVWLESDIAGLEYNMQEFVRRTAEVQRELGTRLAHLRRVADMGEDYLRPKQ